MTDYGLIADADLDRAEERALVRVQAALDALRAHEAATEAAAGGQIPKSQATVLGPLLAEVNAAEDDLKQIQAEQACRLSKDG